MKKIIAFVGMAALTISMSTSVFAASAYAPSSALVAGYGFCGNGFYGNGYNLMRNQDGDFLDKDVFEAKLDQLINDGFILAEDKDYFLERYDWCVTYGGTNVNVRGRGRGMGCGMGRGW